MTKQVLRKSAMRVQAVLAAYNFDIEVKELKASARTAQEAVDAIGCTVAQIAKSLIFKGKVTGKPILVITSGSNRVNQKAVGQALGEELLRADADFVYAQTGYKIGGVPPVGHKNPPITVIDADILTYDEIWAAAGTPFAVFRLTPDILTTIANGKVMNIL